MSSLVIKDESLASAFFKGFGEESEVFGNRVKVWVDKALNFTMGAIGKAVDFIGKAVEAGRQKILGLQLPQGVDFGKWLEEDPLGATAGAGAVLLTAGVVVAVGVAAAGTAGAISGAIASAGGIKAALAIYARGRVVALAGGLRGLISVRGLVAGGKFLLGKILFTKIRNWMVQARQFIWNFNWQISDQSLRQRIDAQIASLYGLTGGALGRAFGAAGCGAIPGMVIAKFNPRLALHIKTVLGEELYEEVIAGFKAVLFGANRVTQSILFNEGFKNIRHFIKNIVNGSPAMQAFLGPERANLIKRWGDPANKPWSFASSTEEWLESIPDAKKRAFLENFLEEAGDACDEAIAVIGSATASFSYP